MSAAWLLPVKGSRSPRRRRRLRLALGVLLGLRGAAALTLGSIYATLPDVADAPRLVAAIDARSHSAPIHVSRTSKLARALIAVEDERFYQHGAIDPVAIGRAAISTLTVGSVDPGGSTRPTARQGALRRRSHLATWGSDHKSAKSNAKRWSPLACWLSDIAKRCARMRAAEG